jgi:cysteinyl-tRNA synthetase
MSDLKLFNSLTRQIEPFVPVHPGTAGDPKDPPEARVYTCGPTVYNYPHIGNMRAYVFADTLGRVLSYKGYKLTHVINITDVGHLTDDADAGEDKMEKMAAEKAQSIWDIARHYTEAYWEDIKALNIRQPAHWSIATDYVPAMIEFAKSIADKHCYELEGGLYFDVTTVDRYGWLAADDDLWVPYREFSRELKAGAGWEDYRTAVNKLLASVRSSHTNRPSKKSARLIALFAPLEYANENTFEELFLTIAPKVGELFNSSRIEQVAGKRNPEDFAIWRTTPEGETRQMEWDSPWGKGAPGWHLECSVMSEALLGLPFDIHTGGIDHREIHHPNEIAQNQARCHSDASGANIWMHNNFLIERSGKMSKSSGEFLRVQLLIDKGFHPLAYRLMCLQAHYRSELEFSWEGLQAAFVRLKRMVMGVERLRRLESEQSGRGVQDIDSRLAGPLEEFEKAITEDLNTPVALTHFESVLDVQLDKLNVDPHSRLQTIFEMDEVLGFGLTTLRREDLRIRPANSEWSKEDIEASLSNRAIARAQKKFAEADAFRDLLERDGIEVRDGDPLGWDWKLDI